MHTREADAAAMLTSAKGKHWADIVLGRTLTKDRRRAYRFLIVIAGVLFAGIVISLTIGVAKLRAHFSCPPHLARSPDGSGGCAECNGGTGADCGGSLRCSPEGICVQCLANTDCTQGLGGDGRTGTGRLNESCGRDSTCRRTCTSNSACVGFPRGQVCVDGACSECRTNTDCSGDRAYCNEEKAVCVECRSSAQCPGALVCSGAGACGPPCARDQDCQDHAGLSYCSDGVCTVCEPLTLLEGCQSDKPRCNESGTECVQCARDDDCPGAFTTCDGTRTCQAIFPAVPRYSLYSTDVNGYFLGMDPTTLRLVPGGNTIATVIFAQSPTDSSKFAGFLAPVHSSFINGQGVAPLGVLPNCVGDTYAHAAHSGSGCTAPINQVLFASTALRPYIQSQAF